jgi:putative Mn2+ efflux pump MntP
MLDLRTPSGFLFTILGLILCAMGIISPHTRAPMAEANVNLVGGVVFLGFGVVMLWMAKRAA